MLAGFIVLISFTAVSQSKDAVIGKWENSSAEGRISIYKKGDKYFGKLYWIKEPKDSHGLVRTDVKNPDAALRSRPVEGIEILKNFVYKGNNLWEEGTVYDPESGKTYRCKLSLVNSNKLALRGFIGISLLGRTEYMKRIR